MANFSYACPRCGPFRKTLDMREKYQNCPICGTESGVILKAAATSRVMESYDNGLMAQAVERDVDTEEIFAKRAEEHNKEMDTKDETET